MRMWLTGKQAMEYLQLKHTRFYELVKNGTITAYELPGVKDPRYKRTDLDRLFKPRPNK